MFHLFKKLKRITVKYGQRHNRLRELFIFHNISAGINNLKQLKQLVLTCMLSRPKQFSSPNIIQASFMESILT